MGWMDHRAYYQDIARKIDGSVIVTTKDHWLWRALAWALYLVTCGWGMKPEVFLTEYATTIGPVQGYPREWPELHEETIVHESGHTRQARWFGLGIHPWVGLLPMAIAYLLLPLPVGLAYVRYILELGADKRRWRYMLDHGASPAEIVVRASSFGRTVSSKAYGWAWPWAEKGFAEAAQRMISSHRGP